jgi:hypothetical protein
VAVTDLLQNGPCMTSTWYCDTYDLIYKLSKDTYGLERMYAILRQIFQDMSLSEPCGVFFKKVDRLCEACIQVEFKFVNPVRSKGNSLPRLHHMAAIYRIVHIYMTGWNIREAFNALKPHRRSWADMCESD